MTRNTFKCPSKLWRKMTAEQRHAYNTFRGFKLNEVAPSMAISEGGWELISHNFSYLASLKVQRCF